MQTWDNGCLIFILQKKLNMKHSRVNAYIMKRKKHECSVVFENSISMFVQMFY